MRWPLSLLALACLSIPAAAEKDRGTSSFCIASDHYARFHVYTATFRADPNVRSDDYVAAFNSYLVSRGYEVNGTCLFTHLPQHIPAFLESLRQQCETCAVYELRPVSWTPE